jgi:chemotaxis protein CheD
VQFVVNISDAKVASGDDDSIITYSLGSCIGVALYDPAKKIAGLLHFQLPSGAMDQARASQSPFMFADTGLTKLLELMAGAGADKKRLKCKIAGGAKMLEGTSTFDIGKRNHTSIRKALWQAGILLDGEDCGGTTPRTMSIHAGTGAVSLKRSGQVVSMNS